MVARTRAGTNGMEPRDVQQKDESCQTCCGAQPRCSVPSANSTIARPFRVFLLDSGV